MIRRAVIHQVGEFAPYQPPQSQRPQLQPGASAVAVKSLP